MSDSDVKKNNDSNNLNTKWFVIVLCLIALTILGFYFGNFHGGLSSDNGVWGTFGDYVGGILNPLIAAFAFYLIARTYELQKNELEATRNLLKISTDAQKDQIKLAALTALLNSNLTRIGMIESEKAILLQGKLNNSEGAPILVYSTEFFSRQDMIENEIKRIITENKKLESLIKDFLKAN
ncbi:MAG: hypothetical protein PHR16_15230 [Methylovulum sp.]|nr:hypothetical protein [Methylovulum sp.]